MSNKSAKFDSPSTDKQTSSIKLNRMDNITKVLINLKMIEVVRNGNTKWKSSK